MTRRKVPSLLLAMLLASCSGESNTAIKYDKPTATEWDHFRQMHIAFGHQSVGLNLLEGVRALAREANLDISIADDPSTERNVTIRQFPIGENGNPQSKLNAFRTTLQLGAGDRVNVAEMKFCFIDFNNNLDTKALATTYINQTAELSARYPDIIFIVTTAPLTTIQTGPKAWIKHILGKRPAGYIENLRRHEFNEILRTHYGSSQTLFDLASIESLHGQSSFTIDNQTVESLAPAISSDGGHLNELGQRLLAAAWIHHLSALTVHTNDNAPSTANP